MLRFDPASAEERRQRAAEDRCVRVSDAGDGMAWLSQLLPAPQAQACYARLDALGLSISFDAVRRLSTVRTGRVIREVSLG